MLIGQVIYCVDCDSLKLYRTCQMFYFSLWPLGVSNIKIRQSIKLHKSSLARSTRTLGILRIYMCLKKSQIYFLYSLNLKSSLEFFKLTIEVHHWILGIPIIHTGYNDISYPYYFCWAVQLKIVSTHGTASLKYQ